MTDRDQWGLRGMVRSCRLERTWYSRRCGAEACDMEEHGDATTLDFRRDGTLSRRLHRNPDGSKWSGRYEYDDRGLLTLLMTESPGAGTIRQCYDYDRAGKLLRVFTRDADGDRTVESYEYDPLGRKSKIIHVTPQRSDTLCMWGVEGTDSAYSAPGAAIVITVYNDRDQPAKLSFHDVAGRELSRVEFRYDDAGQLVEEVQTNSEEPLPAELLKSMNAAQLRTVGALFGGGAHFVRCMHAYDGQGRRIETRSSMGPLGVDQKMITYNQYGDPIIELCEHEGREYAIDDEGRIAEPTRQSVRRSETRIRYEYDSQGNWVVKTVEGRATPEDPFVPSAMERRSITYFD